MKIITFLVMLLISAISFAQYESTSFEEPEAIGGNYTDTGDATMAHDLIDNAGEPFVNFPSTGEELGFTASYAPYDTPGVGLTDGDSVGVTSIAPDGDHPFPDGVQGYKISDVDGNFILEFDKFELTGISAGVFINYFIADTGFEGDGTENASGSDRIRIYVKNLTDNTEQDILNSTGTNINELGLQGAWQEGDVSINDIGSSYQLVIEARCNASTEAFFFDNIQFAGILGLENNSQETFSIYPNPASNGYVNVTSSTSGVKTISVYDVLGKQIINTTISSYTLNVSELTSGVYILKIIQNGILSTKKLVIK
jgi:hypothetical protein